MPRPTHRIDLLLVSHDSEHEIGTAEWEAIEVAWAHLPPEERVAGGYGALRLDIPGRQVLYANQMGGFRVSCPSSGDNIAPAYGRALLRWKAGESRSLDCPACDQAHDLATCLLAPPGAFGRWAIVFSDAQDIALSDAARRVLESQIGPVYTVVRRPV